MSNFEFEDFKQSILPVLTKKLATPGVDLDTMVRTVVGQFQLTLEFSDEIRDLLIDNLRTNFNNTATLPALLRGKEGYEDWLKDKRNSINWKQWNRYKYYLRTVKGWSEPIIQSLDEMSDRIIDLLADPKIPGRSFDRRGLVMGYVQSGKTANFTALINKSFDAGFQVIIVLAGLHNNLRSQTQIRLDEEVIGFTMKRKHMKERFVGVGLMKGYEATDVISLTNSDEDGDFSEKKAGTMFKPPILLVVKKNKTILTNLLNYLQKKSHYAKWVDGIPHKVVTDLPLLIIDDEADQATVNTSEIYDEDDNLDPEFDPSTINGLIRDIFHTFEQRAYVGYTATPFANMLIDRNSNTDEHGDDLFPRDFIVGLPKPSNYAGPAEYFDLYDDPDNQQAGLVRHVIQDDNFIPESHKKTHDPGELPKDLISSIYAYMIATAIRRLRGQKKKHSSMLVHVTRYTDVQWRVYKMIDQQVTEISNAIRFGKGTTELDLAMRQIYQDDFVHTSSSRKDGGETFNWEMVRQEIIEVLKKLEVKQIHGKSTDVLDFEEHKDGHYVIAVGGDKLSRGLTLEGLTVSYYLRTSKVYDTLMQMGRWFGYRDGYFDLCRIYTTEELANWFYHIAIATEELRAQLDEMSDLGMTPDDYVLQISMHPDMRITSPNKMRSARAVKVSYSASLIQTTVFENKKDFFAQNFHATEKFIERLGGNRTVQTGSKQNTLAEHDPIVKEKDYYYWEDVPADQILFFLDKYKTTSSSNRVDTERLTEYIINRNKMDELISWTVVILNSGKKGSSNEIAGLKLYSGVKRTGDIENYSPGSTTLSIRILTSEGHEYLDFSETQREQAEKIINQQDAPKDKQKSKANQYANARALRSAKNGLLLLYPLSVESGVLENAKEHLSLNDKELPIGFAISFPKSTTLNEDKDYIVNKSVLGD